ncbi:hypothetical protein [Xenorhabdus sp. BG5]|uniref:hypothetical protein n=1 Tax=Xenorhabdus sp. BG5 TaxID=2782014 RepID=UPI0018807F2A|nr:hypothetical protein [Xenorhabdus sp. BG5]MBE8596862.1 hypothetical protein [Xenorhabdus sp. BG5]
MSEIDFEALGRCHHLKGKINDTCHKRDGAFRDIKNKYHAGSNPFDAVYEIDMAFFHQKFKELDEANTELTILVNEYNQWAGKAGERPIRWIKSN